uniref:MRH domain-containing protein n=1 Tax=Vannella robusta TaxID=1487602 RepID=A0A7S4HPV8_9EUKA
MLARMTWHVFFLLCVLVFVQGLILPKELESERYKVVFVNGLKQIQDGSEIVDMYDREGSHYSCAIPPLAKDAPKEEETSQEQLASLIANILDSKDNCLIHGTGWWSYEFCFGDKVRQFHVEGTTSEDLRVTVEYILGKHSPDEEDFLSLGLISHFTSPVHGSVPYVGQTFVDGTYCDLASGARHSEIRFYCLDPTRDFVAEVKEPASCAYTVNVNLSELCQIKEFGYSKREDNTQVIYCHAVDA